MSTEQKIGQYSYDLKGWIEFLGQWITPGWIQEKLNEYRLASETQPEQMQEVKSIPFNQVPVKKALVREAV